MRSKPMRGISKAVFLCVLLSVLVGGSASASVSFSGYVREDFSQLWRADDSELGTLSKLRGEVKAKGVSASAFASVEFFKGTGFMEDQLDNEVELYRAYVDFFVPRADIRVGRQRIAWGTGLLWNPTDVYSPVDALDPKKEFEGVDAIRTELQLAELVEAILVIAPEDKADSSRVSARLVASVFGLDVSGSYTYDGPHGRDIFGLDTKGEWEIGFWAEGALFTDPGGGKIPRGEEEEFYRLSAGLDYTLPVGSGIYVAGEYYRDESGSDELTIDDFASLANGDRESLGTDYIFFTSSYTTSRHLNLRASAIGNLDDGSLVLFPTISYRWSDDLEVLFGVDAFLGDEGSEFNPDSDQDPLSLYPDALAFLWVEYSF